MNMFKTLSGKNAFMSKRRATSICAGMYMKLPVFNNTQPVFLNYCFDEQPLDFLVVPHLSVAMLIGHSDIIKFNLLQQNI